MSHAFAFVGASPSAHESNTFKSATDTTEQPTCICRTGGPVACHFGKSPDLRGPPEMPHLLSLHLTQERRPRGRVHHRHGLALRFFYHTTLKRALGFEGRHPRRASGTKSFLSVKPEEVARFLGASNKP